MKTLWSIVRHVSVALGAFVGAGQSSILYAYLDSCIQANRIAVANGLSAGLSADREAAHAIRSRVRASWNLNPAHAPTVIAPIASIVKP